MARYHHNVYAANKTPRYLVIFDLQWKVIDCQRLQPCTDLRPAMTAAIDRLSSEGWQPEGDIYRQTTSLFRSMVGTLNHNYQVDLIWQAHLLGKEHAFSTRRDILHPTLEDLVQAQMAIDAWLIEWATQQTSSTLSETVAFRFVSGQDAKMQKGSMLLHVINHKTYHRGWVSQMFFDVGAKPPETDLSVYLCNA